MAMRKRHKMMIGGLSTIVIIALIANSVLLYMLFVNSEVNYNNLETKIAEVQADSESKISQLSTSLIETKETLGSLDTEFDELKATASADFSGIIENAIKSVVTIRTDVAQGTGFIVTNDGYIVTNAHVLAEGREVWAINYNQQKIDAEFIGYSPDMDIALLKISGDYYNAEFADSDNVQVGEKVIAIGNPLGLQFSVTEGIISGTHRQGANNLYIYIQTDAALNPGNSGGPLINTKGEVIGINNFKVSGGESLGFALESNHLVKTVNIIAQDNLNQTLI